ncbi:hypothetical protein CPEBRM1_ABPJDJAI_01139 [Companilactobacillus paralimentarius]
MQLFKENRFWILTSLETIFLGLTFSNPKPYLKPIVGDPSWIGLVDIPPFSLALVLVGAVCLTICLTSLSKFDLSIVTFLLSLVWIFSSIVFIVHDINMPGFCIAYPHIDATLSTFVAVRITIEAIFGTKHYERSI